MSEFVMVGSRFVVAGAIAAVAALASERAVACLVPPPPIGLLGVPAAGESNVPTNVVFVYHSTYANLYEEAEIERAMFELVSSSGASVALKPQVRFAWHFELVPETELEPSTTYTLRATLPLEPTYEPSQPVTLSFTTGEGPLTGEPGPPDARMQHYHSTDTVVSSCDPPLDGSCVFFPAGTGVELSYPHAPETRYLVFGAWGINLTGVNQGTPSTCVTLRTRAADGTMSEPVELCQEDAETFMVPDLAGLACTENGLAINGVPIAGAGGSSGGTGGAGMGGGTTTGGTDAGGSATGGVETGGTDNAGGSSAGAETGGSSAGGASTGGTDNTAGAAEPDDSESRTIMTEGGCGCRTPTQPRERHSALWLALVLSLLAFQRRRARR